MAQNKKNTPQYRLHKGGLISDFNSIEADAIIRLQTNIEFASLDKKITCFAVTSAQEAEGKTTTSCNLALLYAEKGLKVCLLDFDLRQPAVHKAFDLKNSLGLVDFVKGDCEISDIIQHAGKVDVVTPGSHTPFPTKILQSPRTVELINELKKQYDYIIIDTPPVLVLSDAYLIGQHVDGYLVVCSQHISKKKDVVAACHSLEEKRMNIIGITMVKVTTDEDQGKGGYGYQAKYGYGYGYGYGYHHKDKEEKKESEEK